jgi:hypothetical protein
MAMSLLLLTACQFCGCGESSNDGPAKTVCDVTKTTEAKEEIPVAESAAVVEDKNAEAEARAAIEALLWWMTGRREIQMFHVFEDCNAKSWPQARRIVTKVEITKTGGTNIRYVVTNMSGNPGRIYRGFYIQRGNVPERPIGELKNGLQMD